MAMQTKQPGFFDVEQRKAKLEKMGDPLMTLNRCIDWEVFRGELAQIHHKERKSNAGAKPLDVVLMFKVLVLQQLNNLSDDRIEYQIQDRLSFMRFLGLQLEDKVPDAKSVWLFRERLKEHQLIDVLFARFNEQLAAVGYAARAGQMIDATFVEVPRQSNTREEKAQIKAGQTPQEWEDSKQSTLSQKDIDARWAKKGQETHYGYKNHINADQENKLVQSWSVTNASIHDSQVFDELLDHEQDEQGNKREVYADSAYRSEQQEERLAASAIPSQICEKGARNKPLTTQQKQSNTIKSKVRARVEHIFGAQAHMGGHIVRTIGLMRATVKIGMMNLVYNMVRLGQLLKRDRTGAPCMA